MFLSMRLKQPTTIGTKSNGNFLDYPEYRERFMAFADGLLKNQFVSEVELSDGNKVVGKLQVPFSFDDSHFVNASYNGVVNAIFGLKDTKTDFKQVFLGQLKENLKEVANEGELELDDSLYSQFHVDQVSIRRNLSDFNYNHVVEFKRKNGTVAYRFGFYDYNTKAVELMLLKKQLALVEGLKPEALQVVFNVFRSGNLNLPEEAPAELKKLVNDLLMETLTVMLSGRDQDGDGKPDPVVLEELPEQVKTIATGFVASTLMKVLTGALDKSVLLHSFIALSK